MTLQHIKDNLHNFNEEEKKLILKPLLSLFTSVSLSELAKIQDENYPLRMSFKSYQRLQTECIIKCIELETSPLGTMVREKLDLKPLTLKTIIKPETK